MRRPVRHNRQTSNSDTPAYSQVALDVSRVARVVKGGRRFRLKILVVLGDRKGMVGVASAKGTDYASAISKAGNVAKRKMKRVTISTPTTIPHEVKAKVGGAQVLLKPAREGTGLVAGGVVRQILEVAGYHNIYSKSLGNSNKTNVAYAVIKALDQLVAKDKWHLSQFAKPAVSADRQNPVAKKEPAKKMPAAKPKVASPKTKPASKTGKAAKKP